MKSAHVNQITQEAQVTVTTNSLNEKTGFDAKIYFNTLFPGFNYTNELGQTITPRKCALL